MNTIDVVVIVVFLGVFTAAFFAGIGKSVAGLFALAIATVAAAIFYKAVGDVLSQVLIPIDRDIADFAAFLLMMLAAGVGADYILMRSFRISRLRSRISLEFRGGVTGILTLMLLSGIVATFMVTILAQSSNNTVQALPHGWGTTWLADEYQGSTLVAGALRLSPYVYDSVDAVTPGLVPAILEPIPRP